MEMPLEKVVKVLKLLACGEKVKLGKHEYKWLDNEIVDETRDHVYIVNGLGTVARRYKSGENWKDPNAGKECYLGASHVTFTDFVMMCNQYEEGKGNE